VAVLDVGGEEIAAIRNLHVACRRVEGVVGSAVRDRQHPVGAEAAVGEAVRAIAQHVDVQVDAAARGIEGGHQDVDAAAAVDRHRDLRRELAGRPDLRIAHGAEGGVEVAEAVESDQIEAVVEGAGPGAQQGNQARVQGHFDQRADLPDRDDRAVGGGADAAGVQDHPARPDPASSILVIVGLAVQLA
jgi:hypothetical protein